MSFDYTIPNDVQTMFEEEATIKTTPKRSKEQLLLKYRQTYRTRISEAMSECEGITQEEAEDLARAYAMATPKDWRRAIRDWDKKVLNASERAKDKAEAVARNTEDLTNRFMNQINLDRQANRQMFEDMMEKSHAKLLEMVKSVLAISNEKNGQ